MTKKWFDKETIGMKHSTWIVLSAAVLIIALLIGPLMGLWEMPFAVTERDKDAGPDVPPEDRVPDGKFLVSSTVKLHIVDLLNEYQNVPDEQDGILFYELWYGEKGYPNEVYSEPTDSKLRDTVNVTSGWAITITEFWSGTYIFVKSDAIGTVNDTDMLYFDYGEIIMVPWADSVDATGLILGDFPLVKSSDWLSGSSNTDLFGQYPVGTDSWADASAIEIDVASLDEITIGVRVYQDDDDCAYADWRSWTDYSWLDSSNKVPALMQKQTFVVFDFQLSGTTNAITTSVDDYLFVTEAGITQADLTGSTTTMFTWGTGLIVFVPIDTMDECGARDVDANSKVLNNHDGYKIICTLTVDVSDGTIDSTDEIDIEISIVTCYSLSYAQQYHTLAQSTSHYFGELHQAWTNDWTFG